MAALPVRKFYNKLTILGGDERLFVRHLSFIAYYPLSFFSIARKSAAD